jgi:hypothetical protein
MRLLPHYELTEVPVLASEHVLKTPALIFLRWFSRNQFLIRRSKLLLDYERSFVKSRNDVLDTAPILDGAHVTIRKPGEIAYQLGANNSVELSTMNMSTRPSRDTGMLARSTVSIGVGFETANKSAQRSRTQQL